MVASFESTGARSAGKHGLYSSTPCCTLRLVPCSAKQNSGLSRKTALLRVCASGNLDSTILQIHAAIKWHAPIKQAHMTNPCAIFSPAQQALLKAYRNNSQKSTYGTFIIHQQELLKNQLRLMHIDSKECFRSCTHHPSKWLKIAHAHKKSRPFGRLVRGIMQS